MFNFKHHHRRSHRRHNNSPDFNKLKQLDHELTVA
jgi:hypothetical protein